MRNFIRPLKARDTQEEHRAATQLELFFDLVTVIAIAAVTVKFHYAISHGDGLAALPSFLFLFIGIWWIWMNFTWFASAFDNDDVVFRLLVIVMMTGSLIYAGGVGYIFDSFDFSIGVLGWVIMRVSLIALWWRAMRNAPELKKTAMRYIWGLGIVQCLWVAAYFTFPAASSGIVIAAYSLFLLELAVPAFAERAGATPWHRHHIIERYGLLNIIVLGEVLLSVGFAFSKLYGSAINIEILMLAASGLLIVFSLWWIYFIEHDHLKSDKISHAFIWGYLHYFIFGAAAALGAGLAAYLDVLTQKSNLEASTAVYFIGFPIAIYLLALWAARDVFHDIGKMKLALPVMASAIILATVLGATPLVLAALTVMCVVWRLPFSKADPS
jgi:low temperature requirement protein LtrA